MLNKEFFFFDEVVNTSYVYENGIITFMESYISLHAWLFGNYQVIAPFWANVDIRGTGNIFYHQTADPNLLARATNQIKSAIPTSSNLPIKNLLIVTWDAVGYYNNHIDKVNTFQCVLATNEFESFVFFLYNDGGIQWTIGGERGFPGYGEAVVGISNRYGNNDIIIPYSTANIDKTSNVGIPGVWIFKVGTVNISIVSDPPGIFAGGSNNNSFTHLVGSIISLTCSIISTPVTNSVFKWRCSTGCLVDVKMEQTISVNIQKSGEIFCAYTVDDIEYSSDPIEIIATHFMVFPSILLESTRPTVGQEQDIVCTVYLLSREDYSAIFTWVTPDGVTTNDGRVSILPTTVDGKNHSSFLHFKYLMETDVGNYECNITINNSTTSLSVELQNLNIPFPKVNLLVPAIRNFGEPLTLICEVTTVRGIVSGISIHWTIFRIGERTVENVTGNVINNSVVYRDVYEISKAIDDSNCIYRGIINSVPRLTTVKFITVTLTSPNAAPRNFIYINKTSTTITFQWDPLFLFQSDNMITWYVITCSSLREESTVIMNVTGSEQIGTVSGLDSFTVYNCSVHAVTKYGGPKSNYITVKTDEGAPSPVQDTLVTLVDRDKINITWSPPVKSTGTVLRYIVKRINSSGTFYHHVSANQHHILLPYFNDALIFVSAFNLFGLSDFENAKPNASCLPSPCINNGTCIMNAIDQLQCNCKEMYFGRFCENIDKLYTFGFLQGDESLILSSSPTIMLNKSFFFYDEVVNSVYVNEKGVISFEIFYIITTPSPLHFSFLQMIAPFWADIDFSKTGNVFYRQTTDPDLLARATNEIKLAFPTSSKAKIKNLLIVTWDEVGYYYQHIDKVNTFQCVLATNEFESFVFFLYNDGGIQWTTGDDSGGVNGLSGSEAIAGFSAGDGDNFVIIPESGSPCILTIDKTSNVGIPGVWMFKVGTAQNAIPKRFRNVSKNCTAITFQWDPINLTQYDNMITWHNVITCSSLKEENIVTVDITGSDQIGNVTDLSPSTEYNCSMYAVTESDGPKSNYVTVKTDKEDMPCKLSRKVTVTRRKATATFSSQHPKAIFNCRLDQNGFKPCTSPVVYKSLSKGQHRITVKARCPCAGPVVRHSKFQIK